LTGDALTQGVAYITAQLNAAAPGARGAVIANTLNLFAGLTADATFGAAATAWNAKVDSAALYTSSADVAIGSVVSASGSVFSLTTGSNTFTGGTGDDTFDAGLSTGSLQTLNSGDRLAGGAGSDNLYAVINTSVTPSSMTGIETVSVASITAAATLDLTNATGVTTVINQGSATALTIAGIASTVAVTIQDTAILGQTVTYTGVTGAADSATVTLQNVTGAATLTAGGIETLNLVTSGSSANVLANLTDASTSTLNVSGTSALNVTLTGAAAVRTINASALNAAFESMCTSSM
jgi:hypothetical protein